MTDSPSLAPLSQRLVAHRGNPYRQPENSLPGIVAALEAGARWIEVDVHMSADGIPVVVHDAGLERLAGLDKDVRDMAWAKLQRVRLSGSDSVGLPSLAEVVERVRTDRAELFVELKRASLYRFGRVRVLSAVLALLRPLGRRYCVISFDETTVSLARGMGAVRCGWVLGRYDRAHYLRALHLKPDYLFCNQQRAGRFGPLWPGPWRWVVYVVDSVPSARRWLNRGADLIETDRIVDLLEELEGRTVER